MTKKKIFIITTFLIVSVIAINTGLVIFLTSKQQIPTAPIVQKQVDTLSYKGEEEKDALTLLKKHAIVNQDKSGLVTSVNGRKADSSQHEYWAFYVNNKMASVGPADYKTRNTDVIKWKIENY